MTELQPVRPADWRERQRAVDITRSCIVQAPAGSGKTELLVQRILALLAVADSPEEILSITFTRKAAGEMRLRLLQALERAVDTSPPDEPHAVETWRRARAVLARDHALGWSLMDNPSRLQLLTIDSFCAFLTRRMPWLARFGDQPQVIEDPADLYRLAAEALLARLDSGGAGQDAVERLLVHLDNRLTLLRDLLVAMLGRRDQWLRHLMARRGQPPRQMLESGLQLYVSAALDQVWSALGSDTCRELWAVSRYAAENLAREQADHPLAALHNAEHNPASLEQWLVMTQLVLTGSSEVRKTLTKANGVPADKTPQAQAMKARALALLEVIRADPAATRALQALLRLPATGYSEEQWLVLEALVELLPLAVVELQEAFRRAGQVDFIEIAGAAQAALGSVVEPEELLLQLDSRIRHILVDEFQDTSYAQYDLLRCLTAGWEAGDGRTLFVVGDPMQSIYRFREAEVGLYLRVCQRGLDSLPMERIVLSTNFRSRKNLVDWVNDHFGGLFPAVEDEVRGAVCFAPATAYDRSAGVPAVSVHGFVGRQDMTEADQLVTLVHQARQAKPDGTIAVLVRSRNHLAVIVNALKKAGLTYQAQDIDPLSGRPVVQDLVSLARALQHPADRVAWLAVLRSPWCGLTLDDLARLCSRDSRATVWQLLTDPAEQTEMFDQLSPDGRQRLERIMPALDRALRSRGRLGLRRLVESTWLALNGPACVGEADLLDVRQVFALLEEFNDDTLDKLEGQLEKLFAAPDPQAGPELQLMTIHKAKGLEFDTVILPGLGRGVRSRERALLRWLEHPDYELLLAPIPPLQSDQLEPTYQAIGSLLQEKDDLETLRLLYVAVTRAKSRLHLLGHARLDRAGQLSPTPGSLLAVAWPALHADFSTGAVVSESEPCEEPHRPKLRRLPAQWRAPQSAPPLVVEASTVRLASASGHYEEDLFRSRRTEEGRVVGTLVHVWLERIAGDGPDRWPAAAIKGLAGRLRAQLGAQGVPAERLEACSALVLDCLTNTVASERGRWLLSGHRDAASELPLNGLIDGQLIHATIDRTFVDEEGLRWVVDYKTSAPAPGESSDQFMARELARYGSQLQLYATLVRQLLPDGPQLRAALYFPVFDGWIEVPV